MTSDEKSRVKRRSLIASASLFALAGCLSGNDLPPPNYEESPNGDETETPTESTDTATPQPSQLSSDEENFFVQYRIAHSSAETGMQLLTDALIALTDRNFEKADSKITDSQLALSNARDIVGIDVEGENMTGYETLQDTALWDLANQMEDNTDIDLVGTVSGLERSITLAFEATRLTREANVERGNGNVDTYRNLRGDARIKLDNAEFYLPPPSSELRSTYRQDIEDSTE